MHFFVTAGNPCGVRGSIRRTCWRPWRKWASPSRRHADAGASVALSGADPLNLVGILSPGAWLAALTANRLLFRDGIPLAVLAAGEERWLETLKDDERWQAHNLLVRRHVPAVLADLS